MVIRAEAQNVLNHVRSVMRPAEGSDMRGLRIWSGARNELNTAHLAAITVRSLYPTPDSGQADYSLHFASSPKGDCSPEGTAASTSGDASMLCSSRYR